MPRSGAGRTALLAALALLALPGCHGGPAQRGAPAIITHPTAASRADLTRAVTQAFGGTGVRLAGDALTRDSLLIIGQAQARDVAGVPLNGRELARPQHFRLLRRGARCVLLHLESGTARVLAHTTCVVLPSGHESG